ncbi:MULTISPECIES: ATP-binding SpoIIE family protein phosphatase [unclassified Streptomyces]|uniref:ATP-binding SpoIIE family protein phosphatase n=1 Tax=unclassified Streptomyces TaxID=2593676 RepID=UPI002DD8C628|nr:SpoIIE family protein phosphatase [Streptomyces sp. NBC_01751]WSD29273.1 SpoIIE family protein phosphatase [Streptomyces sp. NBC_01751]WSF82398.1 SpoIIE family protein phosphatase [Streptomyces sp. NBC_01744]
MDFTADSLLSRAAHELSPRADELIRDVEQCLRREVPELWDEPDIAQMTRENVAEHVIALLFGIEHGVEPRRIAQPAADAERARRLAQRGKPVTAMMRSAPLAHGRVLDRLLEELPRLSNDAESINAAARKLIALSIQYMDRTSETGVLAFQEERDRRVQWRLSVVNEASVRVGTTLDIARTAQELADLATEHLADAVTVDLLDTSSGDAPPAKDTLVVRRVVQRSVMDGYPETTCLEAICGESPVPLQQLHRYPDGSPPARALVTGQPSRHHIGPSASMLLVPLCARGTTLGVAHFFRHHKPDAYGDEDLLLAQEIAARAAVAIDNARRYTHARATALTLQRSLLPHGTPAQSAVEVACRYLPAATNLGVGGDWYDVIQLSGARVALVVGDVVGHGIHAAATMGRLRTAVRTLADIDLPPDELLTHLDDVVIRLSSEVSAQTDTESAGDIGATCLYAVYDPVAGCCSLARAGHVLPTVMTRDGTADILELPAGPPLGLGGLPFESAEIDLPEGSLIALYTDGLIEALDHDIEAGLTRLRQALAQSSTSLEATCDTVLEALLPADRPHDDVALLLARTHTLGDSQVATWDVDADPAEVARVRASVSEQLTTWGLAELDFTTELVVSELVTNAIRYGRPPIQLRLIHDRTLMCEVADAGNTTPHLRRARAFDEGGRGLFLVAQLAEHWGTRHARRGKTVWAECATGTPELFSDAAALDVEGLPEVV